MEKTCQYCGAVYKVKPCNFEKSKFCSRRCHDKGKTYKAVGTWKIEAIELRLSERLSVRDIAKRMGLPYRKIAGYVREYPLSDEERANIRNMKLRNHYGKIWPKSNSALFRRLNILECEYPGCTWRETLEIHHIDGDKNNNSRCNLQVLCPNHHSLTSNYRNNKRQKEDQ